MNPITFSPAGANVDSTDPAEDWVYVAEGGANTVYAYAGPDSSPFIEKVIRVRKGSARRDSLDPAATQAERYFHDELLPLLVSATYLPDSYKATVPFEWINLLKAAHEESRNQARREQDPRLGPRSPQEAEVEVMVLENLLGGTGHIAFEIKPKAGYIPSPASLTSNSPARHIKTRHCRFCLHRNLRISKAGQEESKGEDHWKAWEYCPLDLYSQDRSRARKAIEELAKGWRASKGTGSSFRVFRDGTGVLPGELGLITANKLADDLAGSSVLVELKRLQRGLLGDEDIELLWSDLEHWSERQRGEPTKALEAILRDPSPEDLVDLSAYTGIRPGSTPALSPCVQGSEAVILRFRVLAFAISATFKDCSIIVKYPYRASEKGSGGDEDIEAAVESWGLPLIKLVDLDLKPMRKFRGWMELDREISRSYMDDRSGDMPPCDE